MIDRHKIEWLGTEWSPISTAKDKSGNRQEDNIEKLQVLKAEIERLKSISKNVSSNALYEYDNMLNRGIRRAQDTAKKIQGVQYIENRATDKRRTSEHAIPQNLLTDAYKENHITFEEMISMPLVDLSEASDASLDNEGLAKINNNWFYPFRRYHKVDIQKIFLPSGKEISTYNWSLDDHFRVYPVLKI